MGDEHDEQWSNLLTLGVKVVLGDRVEDGVICCNQLPHIFEKKTHVHPLQHTICSLAISRIVHLIRSGVASEGGRIEKVLGKESRMTRHLGTKSGKNGRRSRQNACKTRVR